MARPATNHESKKAEIIEAALESFATYGYEGTTNKTIAAIGDFSPSLIYHYFPGGKAALFQASIQQFGPIQDFVKVFELNPDDPPQVYLKRLALAYLQLIKDDRVQRLIRLVLSEGPRFPELMEIAPPQLIGQIAEPVIAFVGRLMGSGQIEPRNPFLIISEFVGPMFMRGMLRQIGIENKLPFPMPSDEEIADTVVQTFLHGLWTKPA